MKHRMLPLVLTLVCGVSSHAFAKETPLRGETFCFPAKDVPKLVEKLSKVKAERRNIVDVRLEPRFIIKDGGVWPDKFYLAKDSEIITEMPFSRETGAVPSFLDATKARPDTDICVDDPTRAARPETDEGLYFEMGLSPLFKVSTGQHSYSDLKQAAKDGKKFYKKMLPDVVSVFMPDTDYFAIKMVDRDIRPTALVVSTKGESKLSLEAVDDMWIMSLEDIEDADGESLIIRGGAYDLQPVPSPKTLRRFGLSEAANEQ